MAMRIIHALLLIGWVLLIGLIAFTISYADQEKEFGWTPGELEQQHKIPNP